MSKEFRSGAIGALIDEYERAVSHLKIILKSIPDDELIRIADFSTNDENCRSIQTILTHVLNSGYGYAISIHNLKGPEKQRPPKKIHTTIGQYIEDLDQLVTFTEQVLSSFNDKELEQTDHSRKIKTGWEQLYDIEQLMEHAIVHILRHRRQIEKMQSVKLK
ncbi:MAG TPA: DinB family protein [Bacteroidia bacterium]|nr:DinB family protein [Bacteroidia bacterium]